VTLTGVLDSTKQSYYHNISGHFDGLAHIHNLTASKGGPAESWQPWADSLLANVNKTEMLDRIGTWNWTVSDKIGLTAIDKLPMRNDAEGADDLAVVHVRSQFLKLFQLLNVSFKGRIEISDPITGIDLPLRFEAIHFVNNGSLYGLAEPNRYVKRYIYSGQYTYVTLQCSSRYS
jgi:hypothetical protein